MRLGLTTPLWRRLSRPAPCYCTSSCYGTMWRTLKFSGHQVLLQHLNSLFFLVPCCSTILHQSRLLNTTSSTYKTRQFFFEAKPMDTPCNNLEARPMDTPCNNLEARPMDTPCNNLRRPRNVSSSFRSDVKSDNILISIKQATSFLKKDEVVYQHETPTAQTAHNLNTSLSNTFSHKKTSASPITSESAKLSAFINKEDKNFDSREQNFSFFNVEGKGQNKDSSYRIKTETANYSSSENQVFGEHQSVHNSRVDMSRRFFEKEDQAPKNRSPDFSGVEDNMEHQPEGKEDVCDGEMSTDRQRFRRRYSRNRSYNNYTPLPDLPANTMAKIKEASHLLRHGTISEQSNTPGRNKYFVQESSTEQTTPAVEPDASTEPSLRRHQGSRPLEKLQTSDSLPNSLIVDGSPEGDVKMDSFHSASCIKDASSAINKELMGTINSPLDSLFSTINKHPTKIPPSSLGSTGESHDTVPAASGTPPLFKSVPLLTPYARQMPRTGAEQLQLMKAPIVSPPNSRLLRVALLGLPNSGKSTLINALLEDRVCSVSNKANSTRCLARAIYTTEDTQLLFLDTPGVVTPEQTIKHSLFGSVVQDAERSLGQADMLLLLHDCSSPFNRLGLHPRLLRVLALYPHIPAMLVMNKVDRVKPKQQLLKMTRLLTDGVVAGRLSHGATPSSKHRDPFRDLKQAPDALIKSFLDSLERTSPKDEGAEEELQSEENELLESNAQLDATQQTQQVSFERLMSGEGPVVLPCSNDGRSKFHMKDRVSDEDVLSGRVKLSEQQLAAFIEGRRGWPYFERVFLTSALAGDGVMDLRRVLEDSALPALWQYPANMVTDQDPYQLATLTVREKFMDKFKYQLPYNLRFEVDNWELSDADSLTIRVRVICQEAGLIKYLVGSNGCHIKTLCKQAEQKLGQIFKADVRLQLIVSSEDEKLRRNKMKNSDLS